MSEAKAEQKPAEKARHILLLLGRLTVLRCFCCRQPVKYLGELCDALAEGDAQEATYAYHAMTAALLETPARRVTGNIWQDFIFAELLETPNRFSELAASGKNDAPVTTAMEHDLELMQELFALNSGDWIVQIEALAQQKEASEEDAAERRQAAMQARQREERIAKLSATAWGANGISIQEAGGREKSTHLHTKADLPGDIETGKWIGWDYDEPGETVEYVADDALALVYRRFLGEGSWNTLTDALQEFHAHFGHGDFLRYRVFAALDEGTFGLDGASSLEWDEVVGIERQKEAFYANALRFVHTGKAQNVLLYGHEGMGKTSMVLAMANELPDLRLVFLTQHSDEAIRASFMAMAQQPFPFLALIDDLESERGTYARFKRIAVMMRGIRNILLVATSSVRVADSSLFGMQIEFPAPELTEFCQMVAEFVRNLRGKIDFEGIKAFCEEWQAGGGDLNSRSALAVAEQLLRAEKR